MEDYKKTKEQLISELKKLRERIAELERSEARLKQTEEELRESEERYRNLFENAPDVIYSISTEDGTIKSLNPAFERFTGWSCEEWIGKPFMDIIHPDDRQIALETYNPVLQGQTPPFYELRILAKSGKYEVGEFRSMPRFENEKVVEEFGVVRVITERKLAEEALEAERENLSVTLRSIGDGVITVNIDGKVLLINRVGEKLTGWKNEEIIEKPFNEVFNIVDEKTRQPKENLLKWVFEKGDYIESSSSNVLISRDGTERIVSHSIAPIRDKESRIKGAVIVFRDITEKRKLEQELLKADKLESVGILAGGIAHDFNNILFGILGNISLLKRKVNPDDKLYDRLEKIEKAAIMAKDLTQQLLIFSKGGTPIMKTASIAELLHESADFALRGSNVRCIVNVSKDLLPVEIDEGQMNQVISNMIINADQAMPNGGVINISAENINIDIISSIPLKPGKYVKISIQDEGVGIPEENIQKIFDPFFTTKPRGSGLGLAISYSIIKNHGGYIDVKSKVGEGTTFSIYIPAIDGKSAEEMEEETKLYTGKGNILVMDDEVYVREMSVDMLNDLGYDAVSVEDGIEAIDVYEKAMKSGKPFDAVIMDLTIPGKAGGKEAIKELLKIDPNIKAIVSSGYSNDPIMAEYKEYGFCGFIVKPYRLEELSEVLHKVIAK
ncbi:MAG: PAS domain-containing hybrid sensor histidine kinase/response regulator [bacterium]